MEYKCDICGKECKQVYLKLSDFVKCGKKIFICENCYSKTEKPKADEWKTQKIKYF